MATHSPMLMAYPGAALIEVSDSGLRPVRFEQMRHFKILRDFVLDPAEFMRAAIKRADDDGNDED